MSIVNPAKYYISTRSCHCEEGKLNAHGTLFARHAKTIAKRGHCQCRAIEYRELPVSPQPEPFMYGGDFEEVF